MPSIPPARRGLRAGTARSVLALAFVCVAALLPGAASAGPDPDRGLFVVEGRGGTTSMLEVEEEIVFRDPRPTLTGGRSHAALLIESVELEDACCRVRIGAVRVTAFRDGTGLALGLLGAQNRLRPGTYRVTLLGDGPVRASYRLGDPEGPAVLAVPRTPIRTQFLGRAEPLPAGNATASVDLPRTLPKGRRALQVLLLAEAHVDEVRMCATSGEQCGPRIVAPGTTDGSPQLVAGLVDPHAFPRDLRWRVSGFRLADDRLRAAAILF